MRSIRCAARTLALLLLVAMPAAAVAATPAEKCKAALEADDAVETSAKTLDSLRRLERACRKDPHGHARALSRRAWFHYQRGELDVSAEVYAEAFALDPRHAQRAWTYCGVLIGLERYEDAIRICTDGLAVARGDERREPGQHTETVANLAHNLALARARSQGTLICFDDTRELLETYRVHAPQNGWVHQMLASLAWDCDKDCPAGLALYRRSCELGHEPACEQIARTPSCDCGDGDGDGDGDADTRTAAAGSADATSSCRKPG